MSNAFGLIYNSVLLLLLGLLPCTYGKAIGNDDDDIDPVVNAGEDLLKMKSPMDDYMPRVPQVICSVACSIHRVQ